MSTCAKRGKPQERERITNFNKMKRKRRGYRARKRSMRGGKRRKSFKSYTVPRGGIRL